MLNKIKSDTEQLPIKINCKKRTLFQKIFKINPMHNWQTRAINRYGLTTYEVCLKCGNARKINKPNEYPIFIDSERIIEFDSQFDKKGNYIFNDFLI